MIFKTSYIRRLSCTSTILDFQISTRMYRPGGMSKTVQVSLIKAIRGTYKSNLNAGKPEGVSNSSYTLQKYLEGSVQ